MSNDKNEQPINEANVNLWISLSEQQLLRGKFFRGNKNGQFARYERALCMIFLTLLVLLLGVPVLAQVSSRVKELPKSFSLNDNSQAQIERKTLPPIDTARLLAEDESRRKERQRPGPMRFAVAANVNFTLANSGTWQTLADGRVWRLRIQTPGAKSHNLGITSLDLPEGAKLWIYDPQHTHVEGPYTSRNRSQRGSLWTPLIEGDEIVVEVFVPANVAQPVMKISTRSTRDTAGWESRTRRLVSRVLKAHVTMT